MILRFTLLLIVLVINPGSAQAVSSNPAQPASSANTSTTLEHNPLETLKATHPRLLASARDWQRLREQRQQDTGLAMVIARIEADAKWLLVQPPLTYVKEGKRLLDISRQALQRILLWSITYKWSGDPVYAERAEREMLNLASFPDWNPSHFLDTAEMTTALALGYDWLYRELDQQSRETIAQAIVEKGLKPGLDTSGGANSWHRSENNWNQVCFAGLTLGALAIGDEFPEVASELLMAARTGIDAGLRPYRPDGVYPEGPSYWEYGTVYQVIMLEALRSALGTTWNLDESPGFIASAEVELLLTGPSEKFYNFFDSSDQISLYPAMFWFARRLENPSLLKFQADPLKEALGKSIEFEQAYHQNRLFGLIALWWSEQPDKNVQLDLPLVWRGDGPNPVGVFRSSWTDPNATFLAFKGGAANLSHGHMDAGSFILEAEGVRWAIDLGRQDYYPLESKGIDLWNSSQNSDRWRVFRLNNFSHNTLTIDGSLHNVKGTARITEFSTGDFPGASLDLSPVYSGQAAEVTRQFELAKNNTVYIRDKLTGLKPGADIRWAMVTKAEVILASDGAILQQGGKTLDAKLLSPSGAAFTVIPAAGPPEDDFNEANPGASILVMNLTAPESGRVQIDVALSPTQAGELQHIHVPH